jgi:hypothetical protein
MTDSQDKPNVSDSASRLDELLLTIRTSLEQDAGSEARSAGAVACRAILGALDPIAPPHVPTPGPSVPAASTSPIATLLGALARNPSATSLTSSPVAALLAAISQIPREQLLEALGGLRWLFGQQGPTYLTRPAPVPQQSAGGGS